MENNQNKCIEDFLTPEEINKIILRAGNNIKEENLRQTPAEKACLHSIFDIEKPTYRWYIEADNYIALTNEELLEIFTRVKTQEEELQKFLNKMCV